MNCELARRRWLEHELEAPGAPPEAGLARHLSECASCAAEARDSARLTRDLAALRTELPYEVDVVARVREALASQPRSASPFPGFDRRAALWITAGLATVSATLAWGALHLPALSGGARESWTLTAALARAAWLMISAVGRSLETAGAAIARALSTLAAGGLAHLSSAVRIESMTLMAAVLMTLLTIAVLARDLRRDAGPAKGN